MPYDDRIVLSECIEPITARECVDIEVEFTLDSVAVRQQVGLSLDAHVVVVGIEDKAVIADNAQRLQDNQLDPVQDARQ